MALTAEQEQAKKELLEGLKSQTASLISDEMKKFGDLNNATKTIADMQVVLKSLQDAKTPEDVTALKASVTSIEDAVKEIKSKFESNADSTGKVKFASPKTTLKAINRNMLLGLADLHSKGAFNKLKNDPSLSLSVYTSKQRTLDTGMKVDNPMSDATSVVPIGSGIATSLTQFEPGLTRVSRRRPFIVGLVDLARTMSLYVSWMEQTNIDTGVAFSITEGAAGSGTYGSFRWTQKSAQVQNIQAMSKITNEILSDLAQAQNEVQTEIIELLQLYLDAQVLAGDGNAPHLKGITQYATAFSNFGSLSVASPNNYDCLVAAILQIQANGTKSGIAAGGEIINIFEPTDIVLNPVDYVQMKLTKDTLGRYVEQLMPDLQNGGEMLLNCKITQNVGVALGKFLVMDATKSHVRIREDAEITLGYVNTDFQDNMLTVKGRLRAAHYIKSNQTNAFVYDSFATVQNAIKAV